MDTRAKQGFGCEADSCIFKGIAEFETTSTAADVILLHLAGVVSESIHHEHSLLWDAYEIKSGDIFCLFYKLTS